MYLICLPLKLKKFLNFGRFSLISLKNFELQIKLVWLETWSFKFRLTLENQVFYISEMVRKYYRNIFLQCAQNYDIAVYVELTIFLLLPKSALNTMYTIKLCQKQLWRNLASVNLKLKKFKLFTQSSTKNLCMSVFNVGGCVASYLTFIPFLTLDP